MKTFKPLLLSICVVTFNFGNAQDVDDYLAYDIPANAIAVGPINTRKPNEKWINYLLPATATSKRTLVACDTYKDDQLIGRDLYKDGKRHGMQREWHVNGQPRREAPYKNGVMHGIFKHWDEEGHLVGKYEMTNGSGTRKIFNTAGVLVCEEVVANSLGNGLYMRRDSVDDSISLAWLKDDWTIDRRFKFYQDGDLSDVLCFSATGLRHGPRIDFSKKGDVIAKQWHVKNKEVTETEYAALAPGDPSLPTYFADARQYKQLVTQEVQTLLQGYRAMPPVKIPLEFDQAGNPVPAL